MLAMPLTSPAISHDLRLHGLRDLNDRCMAP